MLNELDDDAASEHNEKLAPLYMVRKKYHEKEVIKAVVESCTDVVNQKILANNFLTLKMPDLIGSTALHFAEKQYNTKLLYLLLKEGADYCIKNSKHHTIVHEALVRSNYCRDYLHDESRFVLRDHEPSWFHCPFVVDILSAQVNLGNPINPCDENGLSHLHIACLVGNTEAVELFLKNGVSSDEAVSENSSILPGLTPLHIAAQHHNSSVVDVLLKNNADKNVRDSRGMSCLHILIEERLKYKFCNSMRTRLRQSQIGLLIYSHDNKMSLEVLLGEAVTWDPNITDDIGLSYLHVACTLQDINIVENLIKKVSNINQAVNMDSPIWSGYTALHFAAHFDVKTVSLLIKHGADLGIADAEGLTPFEICLQRFTAKEICSLLKLKTDWKNVLFSDGKTKLFDLIYAMRNRSAIEEFLKNKVANINMCIPPESCIAAGYTPLHFAVIATGIAKTNLKACKNVDYQAPYESYVQRNAADTKKYYMNIVLCLQLGADVTIQDKRGLTPLHLSLQLNEYLAAKVLFTKHDKMVNSTDVHGTSHFHVACVVSHTKFIEKLLSSNKNIINEPVKNSFCYHQKLYSMQASIKMTEGSTPLHIAVAIRDLVLTKLLVEYDVDISAKDAKGLTPLDLAIFMHKEETHLATAYQDISHEILKLLIKCKCNAIAQNYSNEPIPLKKCLHEYDILVRDLLVLELGQQNIIQRCVLEDMGITMLHIACALDNFGKIQHLLDEGANVNDQIHLDSPIWPGCTPLHILMSLTPKEVVSSSHTDEDLIAHIPVQFISLNSIDYSAAVSLLLDYGADVTIGNAEMSTPIHEGFENLWFRKDKHSLKLLLTKKFHPCASYELMIKTQKNFAFDPVSVRGMSHFHVACALDEVETVKKFLEHGANLGRKINSFSKHFGGYTSLHFAVHFKSKNTVDLLLKHGADINSKDAMGNTPLHIFAAHSSSCVAILESLLSNGANMNITNLTEETCFETIFQWNRVTVEAINIYKKYGCLFNSYNAVTKEGCLTVLLNANDKEIIGTVFDALDIVAEDDMGRTLIHNLVAIIKHDGDYTTEDNSVEDEFVPWEKYYIAIGKLTRHGLDINHQDKEGLTALHIAAQRRNYSGMIGLLKNGADVNVTDTAGKTAFVYSTEIAVNPPGVFGCTVNCEIFRLCLEHVLKMLTFKLDVITQNVDMWNEEEMHRAEEFLKDEIVKIKDEKWRTCLPLITLESFLQDIGPVAYSMMNRLDREKVDDFFQNNAMILDQEFPELDSILLLQYQKARARVELIDLAYNCLGLVVGFDMPFLCAEAIFKFLRNCDLKNLIVASSVE